MNTMTKTKILSPTLAKLHFGRRDSVESMLDHNNNERAAQTGKCCSRNPATAAIQFKYCTNADQADIDEFRHLLAGLRAAQAGQIDEEEFRFYEDDFERMMADDWLVTRFLLRGKKAFRRAEESGEYKTPEGGSKSCSSELDRQAVLAHTLDLVKVCARYRFDYRINGSTSLLEFPPEWVRTEGLFNYKPDARGNPTIFLRVAFHRPRLIETPERRHLFKRYMLYNLERCDQDLYREPGKAICCVFDMTNVAFDNIDLELTSWMIRSFKSSSPKLVCYVLIYNPPWFFAATFKVICNTLLSSSKRQTVKFASGTEILNYIDRENLPPYLSNALD